MVIHGIISEEYAKGIVSILKEFKDYKITQIPVIMSSYNYKVVQIKKSLEEYLAPAPVSTAPVTPVPTQNPPPAPVIPAQKSTQPPILEEDSTPPSPISPPKKP